MRTNPERFARNVLLTAFAVFLTLCVAAAYSVQWFILKSLAPMDVTLSVSRGTVSVVPPDTGEPIAVTDQRGDLQRGARIITDSTSQGLLSFKDPRTDLLVAEWVLHHDSEVALDTALAPRFGLNRRPYTITGTSTTGTGEVLLLSAVNRRVVFTVNAKHATALFDEAGHYLLDVSDEATRVTTRQGVAKITTHGPYVVFLNPDQRVTITGANEQPVVQETEHALLENGDFRLPDVAGWEVYVLGSEPLGEASSVIFEGRPVVLLNRPLERFAGGLPFDHGEIGLEQTPNLSVRDLSYLEVRATFRVAQQSLSTCGVAGSECPLMIRLDYRDQEGVERAWIHGFYVTHNPALEYPLRCDTCPIDHERIALDRWYTFESGNLMALLPNGQKPATITSLRFYASGHAFKLYVAEMNLLGAP